MDTLVRIEDLCKSFGDYQALDHVSVEMSAGEVVALIGSSGSGKSTLLRCVNGLERPTSGSIWLSPTLTSERKGRRSRRTPRIGMVFQHFNLYPHVTSLKNVMLALVHVDHIRKQVAREMAMERLSEVGMERFADRYPGELSGGQQQRVAIARALAQNPGLMLFDEPTSALDPEMVGEVLAVMRQLAERGTSMLVATHEMGFARDVASRVVYLDVGAVVEAGASREFFESPRTMRAAAFLGKLSGAESLDSAPGTVSAGPGAGS
ncbi:MAG: amino acid ABC transporter ATP-binding protein [Acidimicrobiales bacterium]